MPVRQENSPVLQHCGVPELRTSIDPAETGEHSITPAALACGSALRALGQQKDRVRHPRADPAGAGIADTRSEGELASNQDESFPGVREVA